MSSFVIGTAGHIDHGKTALVKALTNIDTDRLKEEKARGITIELGFAEFDLGDNQKASIVDVPGHERFVKNMVAGTSGIDMVLFVIAADEGIMPQTREHLDICQLLGIEHGIIALTKIDLVDDKEWLDLVKSEIKKEFKDTFLEDSPIVPVSSQNNEGIDALISSISKISSLIKNRSETDIGFLAIDRVFSMHGFGTVVTGTLSSGKFKQNDLVDIVPDQTHRLKNLKIRGLQVHGQLVESVSAAQRTAINFSGVSRTAINRGQVVTIADTLETSPNFECTVELVAGAKPLKSRSKISFHTGCSRTEATITIVDQNVLSPEKKAYALIRCTEPIAALPGHRYIMRGNNIIPGRGTTIGGGKIINILPPRRRRKEKHNWKDELVVLEKGSPTEKLYTIVNYASTEGLNIHQIEIRTGFSRKTIKAEINKLQAQKKIYMFDRSGSRYLTDKTVSDLCAQTINLLTDFHKKNPLLPGMPLEQIRSSLTTKSRLLESKLFKLIIEETLKLGITVQEGENLRLSNHQVSLDHKDSKLLDQVKEIFQESRLTPPGSKEIATKLGRPEPEITKLIEHLTRTEFLTHISGSIYITTNYLSTLRKDLISYLDQHGQIDTPTFKSIVNASRKYVIPLAEYFDNEKTTIRVGDIRKLRKKS
jgi:selenocysteine-specific elongation factor